MHKEAEYVNTIRSNLMDPLTRKFTCYRGKQIQNKTEQAKTRVGDM